MLTLSPFMDLAQQAAGQTIAINPALAQINPTLAHTTLQHVGIGAFVLLALIIGACSALRRFQTWQIARLTADVEQAQRDLAAIIAHREAENNNA